MKNSIERSGGNRKSAVTFLVFLIIALIVEFVAALVFLSISLDLPTDEVIQPQPTVSLDSAKMVHYQDSDAHISFVYPNIWPVSTTKSDRENSTELIDVFSSQDASDFWLEGFSVFELDAGGMTFTKLIDNAKNYLSANDYTVLSESDLKIDGKPTHMFETSGKASSDDGKREFSIKKLIYLINLESKYIEIDFSDQVSTYNQTSALFKQVIDSTKFK